MKSKKYGAATIIAFLLFVALEAVGQSLAYGDASSQIPSIVLGRWTVGKPYDVGQPIGLNAKQEDAIIGLVIKMSPSQLTVCGRHVPITSVSVAHLTSSDFLAIYNFTPNRIGLGDADILDISLNSLQTTKACSDFADPGTHLLVSKDHAVVEVGGDLFNLVK